MCGIAGIIYRDGGGERHVGRDMTAMLQAMKHRGPDSTGYALYRPEADGYVMHVKLAEANGHQGLDFEELLRRSRKEIEGRGRAVGAAIQGGDTSAEHALTITFYRHARPDGHRVGRGHRQRAPLLGVSVPGRGRGTQRPAHELLPMEAPARAGRPPLPVRVRLRDHRRVPR